MQYTKHLEEEIIRVTERKKWIQTKWDKGDKEIKETIKQSTHERKGYNRTIVPASTMYRWVQLNIKSEEGQETLKQNHSMAIINNQRDISLS